MTASTPSRSDRVARRRRQDDAVAMTAPRLSVSHTYGYHSTAAGKAHTFLMSLRHVKSFHWDKFILKYRKLVQSVITIDLCTMMEQSQKNNEIVEAGCLSAIELPKYRHHALEND